MRLYSEISTKHDIRQDAHVDADTCRLDYMRIRHVGYIQHGIVQYTHVEMVCIRWNTMRVYGKVEIHAKIAITRT